ncbi:MAG TPA: Flp pilus assembly protein CpaB [Anaerolineaceae bacterium]|nr:Flp pilus assembly protein CpaB [Anaerolineaceae bacterium]
MNKQTKIILFALIGIILVGVGLIVALRLNQQLLTRADRNADGANAEETPQVNVVVTTHDLFLGDFLGPEDLAVVTMPSEFVPRNAVTSIDDAANRFVKTDMVQGEMVLKHNLADPTNINHDIAYILSDSHVLFAFPADDLMSVNSVIQRGDIVDILATISIDVSKIGAVEGEEQPSPVAEEENTQEKEVHIITMDAYQAVEITALVADIVKVEGEETDPAASPDRGNVKVRAYLLALPPQDALLLKHLVDTGATFDMVLRAPTSRGNFDLIPVTKEYIVELYGLGIVP